MPTELAKLDAESAKGRNRREAQKHKNAAAMLEAARHKANVDEKEAIMNNAHAILMFGGELLGSARRPNKRKLVGRPASAVPLA
ncbi:Subtilisin-like protease [Hordeum vulgare]|nr:Subtilisin-like protease [Hordeum vulgare]